MDTAVQNDMRELDEDELSAYSSETKMNTSESICSNGKQAHLDDNRFHQEGAVEDRTQSCQLHDSCHPINGLEIDSIKLETFRSGQVIRQLCVVEDDRTEVLVIENDKFSRDKSFTSTCQHEYDADQSVSEEIELCPSFPRYDKTMNEHSATSFDALCRITDKDTELTGCSHVAENIPVLKEEDCETLVTNTVKARADETKLLNAMIRTFETEEHLSVSSLVADIRELHNQLTSLTTDIKDDNFGLQLLFSEKQRKIDKSKSAKKRKKQQQKWTTLAPHKPNNNSRFAQCSEDLVFGRETEIDTSLTCPVCLELYYLPRSCHPCGHIFCDPCLRRLTANGWEEIPCPLCRAVIQSCELQEDFDRILKGTHPDIYGLRATFERRSKFRHYKLPFTPPVPLGRRLVRHLRINSRSRQSDSSWMSHDWFKFLLGCTVGVCTSMLIMLLNRVKSINDVRDVNIMFLSLILGASLTVVVFKLFKIS